MKTTLSYLFLAVSFSSCSHYFYMPNAQNVPLFKEKNECRLSVAKTTAVVDMPWAVQQSITEVQGAFSITDYIAVMTNFLTAKAGDFKNHNADWGKAQYLEGAVGYYKPIKKHWVFETYSGFGASKQHHEYRYEYNGYNITTQQPVSYVYYPTSDLSFTKIFLQPSFGFTSGGFDIALSAHFCGLYFSKINYTDTTNQYHNQFVMTELQHHKNSFLVEPALTIRGGWKYVKLQLQAVYSKESPTAPLSDYFIPLQMNIGLSISVAKRYWAKQPSLNKK